MNVDKYGDILKVAKKKKNNPLQMLTLPLYHERAPPKLVHACSVAQSCLTLCNPINYSPPGSTVHGIFQARILQGIFPTQRSNPPLSHLLHWQADFFTIDTIWEALPLNLAGEKSTTISCYKNLNTLKLN